VLLHLVDGTSEDVGADWRSIVDELEAYGSALAGKPRLTALNKVDALAPDMRAEQAAALKAVCGDDVMLVSGVSGEGVDAVLRALWKVIALQRQDAIDAQRDPEPWRP